MSFRIAVLSAYAKAQFARGIATMWKYAYRTQYRIVNWKLRYGPYAIATTLLLLLATTFYLSPRLQDVLAAQFPLPQHIEELRALVLGVGSALLGAAAIVTSLVLFEAALDARGRGCDVVADETGEILLAWTFKGGRFETGWGTLERGLCACAVFALMGGEKHVAAFRAAIDRRISSGEAPAQELREHTARRIRDRARRLQTHGDATSRIDVEVGRADREVLSPLLHDIADILSAANRPIPSRWRRRLQRLSDILLPCVDK